MKKMKLATLVKLSLTSTIVGGALLASSNFVSAHGYVEEPMSRGYVGMLEKDLLGWSSAFKKYGNVITNPQSLEAKKGFPIAGPSDGEIASAGGVSNQQIGDTVLDIQTSDRWNKQDMNSGINYFTWHYTAEHSTTKWHYYITKKGWDQNAPLTRAQFEPIGTIEHDGSAPSNNPVHKINVPKDRNGYHVILAIWDVADTPNAFYNVIDVNLKNNDSGEEDKIPEQPQQLKSDNITNHSVKMYWTAPSNTEVKEYNIYRDDVKVGTVSGNNFTDTKLKENTKYNYQVEAVGFNDKVSEKSLTLSIETKATPNEDTEKPSTPTNVHTMAITSNSVDLMWTKSTHPISVKEYLVYRDGKKITTTSNNKFLDNGLKSNQNYTYTIKAVSFGGNISEESTPLKITTKVEVPSDYREWKLGSFTIPETYTVGELVSYKGINYKVLNSHTNYGDTTWAPDIPNSLFQKI